MLICRSPCYTRTLCRGKPAGNHRTVPLMSAHPVKPWRSSDVNVSHSMSSSSSTKTIHLASAASSSSLCSLRCRMRSLTSGERLEYENKPLHPPVKIAIAFLDRNRLALLTLPLPDLSRETGLDSGDGPARATRVARHEVQPILSLVQLGIW